jgi:pimeloyl-ACP methyl ester carboxylesterase
VKRLFYITVLPLLGASATILHPLAAQTVKAATMLSTSCIEKSLPVALAPGEPVQYQIYGELCSQYPIEGRTVQVLVSGLTYDHNYWDFPYDNGRYSYVNSQTEAGYVTFNIDRIGIGNSSRPPNKQVTLESNTYVLAQINQALRNGNIQGVKFDRIINVGHSFGSFGPIVNAVSQYGGVDGVILTGFLHNVNTEYANSALNSFYSAQLDPVLSNQNLPDGYLTTLPGTRGSLYYNESNTDPQVIALDEQIKSTLTTSELASLASAVLSDSSKQIKVPTLLAIGEKDNPFCTGSICDSVENVIAFEAPFYSPEAQLQAYVLPNAGHDINLSLNAALWYSAARQWSDRFVGTNVQSIPEPSFKFTFLALVSAAILQKFFANTKHAKRQNKVSKAKVKFIYNYEED